MDRAAPTSLLWLMARHCVRLLTALAIFAAALGATAPASASADPVPRAQATVSVGVKSAKHGSVETPDAAPAEPEPITVVLIHPEPVEPAPAYLAAVGQRAPPVS